MDKLISEKYDFDHKRRNVRDDLDAKQEQLEAVKKYFHDLAIGRVKQVAEVVLRLSSNTSIPNKARLFAENGMSTWTE